MDDKIIEALERCLDDSIGCGTCPEFDNGHSDKAECELSLLRKTVDLINRQKAEIERLQKQLKEGIDLSDDVFKIVKTEAYKEFAERLKESTFFMQDEDGFDVSVVYVSDIDRTLKELSEVSDNA